MNTRNIDPLTLPSLPLKERSSLPSCPAIYFVTASDNVVYIGKAANLASRWVNHHKWSELTKIDCPVKIAWLECSDDKLLEDIEAALIEQFKPKLNIAKCKSSNKEIRGYIPVKLTRLVKIIAAIRDESISDTLTEAIQDWLNKPKNQELIKKHNLKDD